MSDQEQIIVDMLTAEGIPAVAQSGVAKDDCQQLLADLADPSVAAVFWSGYGQPYVTVRRVLPTWLTEEEW